MITTTKVVKMRNRKMSLGKRNQKEKNQDYHLMRKVTEMNNV